MKFITPNILILLAILFSCSLCYETNFTLTIMGDQGQIEYFYNQKAKRGSDDELKKQLENFYSNVFDKEDYITDKFQCIIEKKNPDLQIDLLDKKNSQQGLLNFNKIIDNNGFKKNYLNKSHNLVFLGDMVYPESKLLINTDMSKNNVIMEKWKKRLTCSWNLFFNSLKKMEVFKFRSENNNINPLLDQNIDIIAGNHSFDIDINKEESLLTRIDKSDFWIKKKDFNRESHLAGIHRYDTSDKTFTEYPKFIEITLKSFKIQFIDFNSGLLLCSPKMDTKAAFDSCEHNIYNPINLTYEQTRVYYKRLYYGIWSRFIVKKKEKANEAGVFKKVWKVMRAHHPPLNSEDGDVDFYFKKVKFEEKEFNNNSNKQNGAAPIEENIPEPAKENKKNSGGAAPIEENIPDPPKDYNLFDLMKEAQVNIFLGSHIHRSEVIAFPYSRKYIAVSDQTKDIKKECKEDSNGRYGCIFNDKNNPFESLATFHEASVCSEISKIIDLPIKDNKMLYVFITGNSGRFFDLVKTGKSTNGFLIWSRAIGENPTDASKKVDTPNKERYGFTQAIFTETEVKIIFSELDPVANEIKNVAEFNVKQGTAAVDDVKVNKLIKGHFCNGKLDPAKRFLKK